MKNCSVHVSDVSHNLRKLKRFVHPPNWTSAYQPETTASSNPPEEAHGWHRNPREVLWANWTRDEWKESHCREAWSIHVIFDKTLLYQLEWSILTCCFQCCSKYQILSFSRRADVVKASLGTRDEKKERPRYFRGKFYSRLFIIANSHCNVPCNCFKVHVYSISRALM